MENIENRSFERWDDAGRRVKVTFVKRNGELFWIRVCTYFSPGVKLRSDYYKEFSTEKFEKIFREEYDRIPIDIRAWAMQETMVHSQPGLDGLAATAQFLRKRR